MLGALQRPAHRDERPLGHQAVGQLDDGGGGHARDRFGPRRVLHDTVASAEHVVDDAFPTDRAPFEEPAVVLVGDDELVDEGQHHCGVGAGADLVPPGAHVGGQVVAERADELERQTSPARLGEGGSEGVAGHPTGGHPGVLDVHAAERHHQLGVLEDVGPGRGPVSDVVERAQHMGDEDLRGRQRVAVDRRRVAADAVEEPVELALRVVEPASARPAVGPSEDRLVAVFGPHPVEFGGGEIECLVPRDLDVAVGAALVVGAGAVAKPALADRRTRHAASFRALHHVLVERRRRRVVGVAGDGDDAVVLDGHPERSPVGEVRERSARGAVGHRCMNSTRVPSGSARNTSSMPTD